MPRDGRGGDRPHPEHTEARPEGQTTVRLLQQAKSGDRAALDTLVRRLIGPLRRWASGRLPYWARELMDTDDLVQETLLKTVRNVDEFEPHHQGALHTYLRTALRNRIREEIRRVSRRPRAMVKPGEQPASDASPLEEVIGREALEDYERALKSLRDEDREAIVARIELGLGYAEVAQALGKPSADAARMAVSRALLRLAGEMSHGR